MDGAAGRWQSLAMATHPLPSIVLLVEDNAVIAMNTEILLQDLGVAQVSIAASVAAALALIEAIRFDFAILDVKLGDEEDSLPIADRLIAEGVPIAFATGGGEEMVPAEGYDGAAMLKKPYGFEDLERLLHGL